ncbi:hypothetical protein [Paenibacillus hamazuiensis]|uniref:hypothetical protein n=1 Tax=Paenibacillus hamazuiensis TaxID=2936508 RepID=UPI0020102C82|nr:hypothetical protein [Paenibacillus hamazuiensis]
MSYRFMICKTDEDWEEYTLYILEHKLEIHSSFLAKRVIHFIKEQIFFGCAVLAKDEFGRIIGVLGFVNGTPENGFADKEAVRLEMVHILSEYRCTRLFYRGMIWLRNYLQENAPETKIIQFYADAGSAKRSRLLGKIADLVCTEQTRFGLENEYVTSVDRLSRQRI